MLICISVRTGSNSLHMIVLSGSRIIVMYLFCLFLSSECGLCFCFVG